MDEAFALCVTGLSKRFGDVLAVDGVSFTVREGEVFGLLGENGAGKTTTLQCVCGLLGPDSGSISVHGIDVARDVRLAQASIGYAPQSVALFPPLTVRENLRFAGELHGMPATARRERIEEVVAALSLEPFVDRRCGELSGGEQRRVNLAMALLHRPRVVVLDEPTANIDFVSRRVVLGWLRSLGADGTTVLYTTHYLEEAEGLCDRVAILRRGRVVVCDEVSSIMSTYGVGLLDVTTEKPVDDDVVERLREACAQATSPSTRSGVSVQASDCKVAVVSPDPQALIVHAFEAVRASGNAIADLTVTHPTLETAFLALTGDLFSRE